MAATQGTTGFGTLLKIGNGATVEVFTTIAEVRNISGPGLTLNVTDATHMQSPAPYEEILPTIISAGEVTFDVNFLPANTQHKALKTDMENRTKRNFQLVFPNTGATKWSFAGYIVKYQPSAQVTSVLSASIAIRISAGVVVS